MLDNDSDAFSLDGETQWISAARALDGHDPQSAPAMLMVERLRRLEDLARCSGSSRQTFQRIASARRLLGDTASFGPITRPFLAD